MCSLKSTLPSLDTSDGLVVTPSSIPRLAASRISLRLAVSMKNFIQPSFEISVTGINARRPNDDSPGDFRALAPIDVSHIARRCAKLSVQCGSILLRHSRIRDFTYYSRRLAFVFEPVNGRDPIIVSASQLNLFVSVCDG